MSKPSVRATNGTTDITATPGWKSGIGGAPGTAGGNGGGPAASGSGSGVGASIIAQIPVTCRSRRRDAALKQEVVKRAGGDKAALERKRAGSGAGWVQYLRHQDPVANGQRTWPPALRIAMFVAPPGPTDVPSTTNVSERVAAPPSLSTVSSFSVPPWR